MDTLPGLVLLLGEVGGRRSLATCGTFVATVFAAVRAVFFALVLLVGASAEAAMRS